MSAIQDAIEGIPGFSVAQFVGEEYAEEHLQTKDPYEDKDGNRRKLPELAPKHMQKVWKKVQHKAWVHDKCFLGSCGVGMDCGVGSVPIIVGLFPVIGPLVMYAMHTHVVDLVQNEMGLPAGLQAKLHGNIVFDLLITFPPVIGLFFGWLNKCSTRNASLLYDHMCKVEMERLKSAGYQGRGAIVHEESFGYPAQPAPVAQSQRYGANQAGQPRANTRSQPRSQPAQPQMSQTRSVPDQTRSMPDQTRSVPQNQRGNGNHGYSPGPNQGYSSQNQGSNQGNQGYANQGSSLGYSQGYSSHQDSHQGYSSNRGFNQGANQGYNQGPNQGFNQDYNQGYTQAQTFSQPSQTQYVQPRAAPTGRKKKNKNKNQNAIDVGEQQMGWV